MSNQVGHLALLWRCALPRAAAARGLINSLPLKKVYQQSDAETMVQSFSEAVS